MNNIFYLDRGFSNHLVLVPGWATDYTIFSHMDLPYNYIMPEKVCPATFSDDLKLFLTENKISSADMLGWSMGGFLAVDFCKTHPLDINKLIISGIRTFYPAEDLKIAQAALASNFEAYLMKFYSLSFSKREFFTFFRKKYLKYFLGIFTSDYLNNTLEYLSKAMINPEDLMNIKNCFMIHGKKDNIAPFCEASGLAKLANIRLIALEECGHMFFMETDIKSWFQPTV